MSDLDTATGAVKSDVDALSTKLDAFLSGLPAAIAKAVQDALNANGSDTATQVAVLQAVDGAVRSETDKLQAALDTYEPTAPAQFAITAPTLAPATVGTPYSAPAPSTSGGTGNVSVSVSFSPDDVVFNAGPDGSFSGTPTVAESVVVTYSATDSATPPNTATASADLAIS